MSEYDPLKKFTMSKPGAIFMAINSIMLMSVFVYLLLKYTEKGDKFWVLLCAAFIVLAYKNLRRAVRTIRKLWLTKEPYATRY